MFRLLRVMRAITAVSVVLWVLAGFGAGPFQVVGAVGSWALLGYLVWRAWPGVRRDAAAVRGALPRAGAYSIPGRRGRGGREDVTL